MSINLEELIFRCIDRYFAGRYAKRYGICTSWDPKTHLAKALLQPEGVESGWLPTHTMAAGDGYGHMSGIMVGEQLEISYQEGDFESGSIVARVHSKKQPPPEVQSGEQMIRTPFKNFIYLDKNSAITVDDGHGGQVKLDGQGNVSVTAKSVSIDSGTGNVSIKCGSLSINSGGGDVSINAGSVPIQVSGGATINGREILTTD